MKKMETSKKILLVSYTAAILLTFIVVAGSFLNLDTANITAIASLAWGEVAVANTFYFKKAARENVPKVIAGLDEHLREQIDVNQLLNQD